MMTWTLTPISNTNRIQTRQTKKLTSKWNMSMSRIHGVFSTCESGTRAGTHTHRSLWVFTVIFCVVCTVLCVYLRAVWWSVCVSLSWEQRSNRLNWTWWERSDSRSVTHTHTHTISTAWPKTTNGGHLDKRSNCLWAVSFDSRINQVSNRFSRLPGVFQFIWERRQFCVFCSFCKRGCKCALSSLIAVLCFLSHNVPSCFDQADCCPLLVFHQLSRPSTTSFSR